MRKKMGQVSRAGVAGGGRIWPEKMAGHCSRRERSGLRREKGFPKRKPSKWKVSIYKNFHKQFFNFR
jgi:hypothetical protein